MVYAWKCCNEMSHFYCNMEHDQGESVKLGIKQSHNK